MQYFDVINDLGINSKRHRLISCSINMVFFTIFVSAPSCIGILNADIGGATRQLLQQNSWAFKQISANIATHHVIFPHHLFFDDWFCLLCVCKNKIYRRELWWIEVITWLQLVEFNTYICFYTRVVCFA